MNVIAGGAQSGIPCSVVMPGDIFTGTSERNAYGTIGVIVDLQNDQSLATATVGDGGSLWDGKGSRIFDERDLTLDNLKKSIKDRRGHNEWGIRNYIVRGIFAIAPYEIWGPVSPAFGSMEGVIPYTLEKLRSDFVEQRIYSFETGIVERHQRGHTVPVRHEEIYR